MPTRLLWDLALFVLLFQDLQPWLALFPNFIVCTNNQPLSSPLVPDKLLERILPYSMCLHPFYPLWIPVIRISTCHSDEIVLPEVIDDFFIRFNRLCSLASCYATSLGQLPQLTFYPLFETFPLASKTLGSPNSLSISFLSSFISYPPLKVVICLNSPVCGFLYCFPMVISSTPTVSTFPFML